MRKSLKLFIILVLSVSLLLITGQNRVIYAEEDNNDLLSYEVCEEEFSVEESIEEEQIISEKSVLQEPEVTEIPEIEEDLIVYDQTDNPAKNENVESERKKMVIIGDSYAEGIGIPHDITWGSLLKKEFATDDSPY
ncbi:MAG: hypothetical protein IKE48_03545, partial [Parasporobacterium sp.]|nr:hypothetical protein [Parasporobacterium sp.]